MVKKPRSRKSNGRKVTNQRREAASFSELMSAANRRAHEKANRKGVRGSKYVWAAVAASDMEAGIGEGEWIKRLMRWTMALLLLPFCWVTSWTFLARFSQAAVYQQFWMTPEFWYFAIGAMVMIGWFWSGLLRTFFLYLYVLGHELTHAVFVLLCRGKVTDFHVSADGGYITTNKTNLVIALSPYFVPFWSSVVAVLYAATRYFVDLPPVWDRVFYALMGITWTFHMAWTLWMIPKDQPDLKENGTFLSLVIIYLANLLVLVGLLCLAADSPLAHTKEFGLEWLKNAATSGDATLRWAGDVVERIRVFGKL